MPAPPRRAWMRRFVRLRPWLIPPTLLLCLALPHLAGGDWQRTDSGWYAAMGLHAWRTSSLLTLSSAGGEPYFAKPPVAFWIHGLALHLFGPGPVAARLPSVLAAAGCVIALAGVTRVFAGRRAATWIAAVLALTYEFFRRSREVSLDLWQLLFLLLALWAAALAVRHARARWWALAGCAVGLALMCKPLTALAAVPVIAGWALRCRAPGALRGALLMLACALLVALPWHVTMAALHGREFLEQYLGAEVVERATGRMEYVRRWGSPPWFYLSQIARHYWPWLVPAALACFACARGRPPGRDARLVRLALVWTVAWLVLLSAFPDRRDRYALPIYPGLALMAGLWLSAGAAGAVRRRLRIAAGCAVALAVPAAGVVAALPLRLQADINPQWPALYDWLGDQGQPELWQAGLTSASASRLYLEMGRWPTPPFDRRGRIVAHPPRGALLVYHRRGGHAPGDNETVVFSAGDLTVTTLGPGPWQPRHVPDEGE